MHRWCNGISLLFSLAILLGVNDVFAAGQPQPAIGQITANPVASRNAANLPPFVNIREYGGYADTLHGATNIGAAGSVATISSAQFLSGMTVTVSATGNNAVISPAWVFPNISGLPTQAVMLTAPGTGGTGNTHGMVDSYNQTTGAILINPSGLNFAQGTYTNVTLQLYLNGQVRQSPQQGAWYGGVTLSDAVDSVTGNVYGTQFILGQSGMLPAGGTAGPSIDGLKVCLETGANGAGGWCGIITNDGGVVNSTTFVATGITGYPTAIQNPGSITTAKVSWGPFLFRPNDATACNGSGRAIEIPNAGSGNINIGGSTTAPPGTPPANYEGTITTRYDAFSVGLSSNVGETLYSTNSGTGIYEGGVDENLTVGCDDYPAYTKAINTIYRTPTTTESLVRIYFPDNSMMASWNDNMMYPDIALQCGDGTVFWPSAAHIFYHGATSCNNTRQLAPFSNSKDIYPAVHLKALNALAPGSTANIVFVGNSPSGPGANGANFISGRQDLITAAFQSAYPDLTINPVDRTIGGQQMVTMDPNSITNGRPNSTGLSPDWYTTEAANVLSYVASKNPTVLIVGYSDQESASISFSAILGLQQATQTPGWLTLTGGTTYPDLIFLAYPYQPTGSYSQQGTGHAVSMMRAVSKACVTRLANGGCWGLIDEGRMLNIAVDGYDPETIPMRPSTALPAYYGNNITSFPLAIPSLLTGLSYNNEFVWSNTAPSGAGLINAAGGELDFTVGAAINSYPQAVTFTIPTSAAAPVGTNVLTIGRATNPSYYDQYKVNTYYGVAGNNVPADAHVGTIDYATGRFSLVDSSGAALNITAPSGVANGASLTFTPPGPNIGYPGNILRIGATGGYLNYRYDTMYWQPPTANCSASAGSASFTCATPQIGNWHRFEQVAIPGAGTSLCPNPGTTLTTTAASTTSQTLSVPTAGLYAGEALSGSGFSGNPTILSIINSTTLQMSSAQTITSGTAVFVAPASTCYIATINTVSFSSSGIETINLTAGNTAATALNTTLASIPLTPPGNFTPWVFRTSIPLTTSTQSTEQLGLNNQSPWSYCSLTAGSRIVGVFGIEFRGSRLGASYCVSQYPGDAWFMRSRYVERWESPFQFMIDSPNHLGGVTMFGGGPSYAGGTAATEGTQNFEVDPWMPTVVPNSRLAPDIYGICAAYPYGDTQNPPTGGMCASHSGQNGGNVLDDAISAQLRLR